MVFELWKNQKNPNGIKIWPDWAKLLFIFLYGTPKLMDFDKKKSYTKIFVPQCSLPLQFSLMTVAYVFLSILQICFQQVENSWPPVKICCYFFLTPSVMNYDCWTFTKFPNSFLKRCQIGIRALIESNIFHKVSKL